MSLTNTSSSVKVMPDNSLYWYGNECASITGGISDDGYGWGEFTVQAPTKNTNSITTTCSTRSSAQLFGTQKTINLSGYSKIVFSIARGTEATSGYNYSIRLCDTKTHLVKTPKAGNATSGTIEGDISSVTGNYYICQYPDYTSVGASVTISRIWLE